uniref:Uncharacterized protein n=1 Tax=Caenorhabditis japonica TaxID=281687 RepID=A0A8R1E6F5_CAEJA
MGRADILSSPKQAQLDLMHRMGYSYRNHPLSQGSSQLRHKVEIVDRTEKKSDQPG